MRASLAAAAFLAASPALAARRAQPPAQRQEPAPAPPDAMPEPEAPIQAVLHPGSYEIVLDGLLCAACAAAVEKTLSKVRGVRKASVNFDKNLLSLQLSAPVRRTTLDRALRKAASRVDLETVFQVLKLRYIP